MTRERPPKPVLSLTIGVVGHRPDSPSLNGAVFDEATIGDAIDVALNTLIKGVNRIAEAGAAWFASEPPILAVVTSLAPGADQIAAQTAQRRGLHHDAVLPFEASAYVGTFTTAGSAERFDKLAASARATLVLPREPTDAASFELAANTVLAQSDIVLAVWNGGEDAGRGGTARSVEEARRRGLPVVTIGLDGATALVAGEEDAAPLALDEATLRPALQSILLPPGHDRPSEQKRRPRHPARLFGALARRTPADDTEIEGFRAFCETPIQRHLRLPGWRALLWLCGVRLRRRRPPAARADAAAAVTRMDKAYHAADAVAVHYAHAFRSAFVFDFALGALASACVAGSVVGPHGSQRAVATLELVSILLLVAVVLVANGRHWRRRWSEAREVAERLRLAKTFWMLGVWPSALGPAQRAWTGWYARSILREQPVFAGDLAVSATAARDALRDELSRQIDYNHNLAGDMRHLGRVLEAVGGVCLVLTIAVAATHAFGTHPSDMAEAGLRGAAIVLPALATACFGVRLFGDFEDAERRAERLIEDLTALRDELQGPDGEPAPLSLAALRARARRASDLMLSDVANWRVVVDSHTLTM